MSKLHAAVQAHHLRAALCVAFWLAILLGGSVWLVHRLAPTFPELTPALTLAWAISTWLLAINLCTWQFWHLDKRLAGEAGRVRVPESLLLLLSTAGGLPAALLAMRLLRHKSAKRSFQWRLLPIALLWIGALGAALWWLLERS
ncbi:MAG: DUF1294 domain-containing protein [Pseudomonadota bacterium]